MNQPSMTIAEQLARAIRDFQLERTGHVPKSITVVLSEGTLVITLSEALTEAEKDLSRTAQGAAQIRKLHQELFQKALGPLQEEIEHITGVTVRDASAEVDPETGVVTHVFTTGSMAQVFQLSGGLSSESWSGHDPSSPSITNQPGDLAVRCEDTSIGTSMDD